MTHGFKNGRLEAEQGTLYRTGYGEFLTFDDGTNEFELRSYGADPESAVTANPGTLLVDPVAGTLYIKQSGSGTTGWSTVGSGNTSLTTKGDLLTYTTEESRLPVGTNGHVLTADSTQAAGIKWAAAAGGTTAPKLYWFSAESLQPLETNFAALFKLEGGTVKTFVRAFDTTTEEYVNGKLLVPSDVDTSGTVTFVAYVMASTAAASKNIGLTFGHRAITNSEDFDGAYTDEDTGAVSIDATQDDVTQVTWTETISNLGWSASDLVLFRLSRDTSVANNLATDMYLFSLSINIPRA